MSDYPAIDMAAGSTHKFHLSKCTSSLSPLCIFLIVQTISYHLALGDVIFPIC